jgi:hypothetical protein
MSSACWSVTSQAASGPSGSAPGPASMATLAWPCSISSPAGAYRGEFIAPIPNSVNLVTGPPRPSTGVLPERRLLSGHQTLAA